MQTEFITAVLEGTIKVADVDPSLQWGLVGGAAGGLGSAIKSIAAGEDLQTGLRRAALMGLLGAGVGGGISAGTRLLGYKGQTPGKLLEDRSNNPTPSVAGSVGVGLAGAAGLGGIAETRPHHFANKALGEVFWRGDTKKNLSDILDGKHEHEITLPQAAGVRGKPQKMKVLTPEAQDIADVLKKHHAATGAVGGPGELPGFFNKLLGRTTHGTEGMTLLKKEIADAHGAGNTTRAAHLTELLKKLSLGSPTLQKFAPAERAYVDPFLRGVKSPKGLLAAAAALGLTHLGVSNLVHNLKKD